MGKKDNNLFLISIISYSILGEKQKMDEVAD